MGYIIRDAQPDEMIADAQQDKSYSLDELHNAILVVYTDDDRGACFQLPNKDLVWLQSIDLDDDDNDDTILRTRFTYTRTYERTTHWRHEVVAHSWKEATELFESNQSTCVDEQESWFTTNLERLD